MLAFGELFEESSTTITTSATTSTPPIKEAYYRILFIVISSLSAFGSVAIIVTYFLWRDLQTTTRRILVYISIGDFFATYSSLVIFLTKGYDKNTFACKFQSFVTSTAIMWSFFWTTSLAIYLYIALVKKRLDISEKLMVIFHVINWCLPPMLLGAALYENKLGYNNGTTPTEATAGWCWIRIAEDHTNSVIWMLITGKLWEIISYFINGILYFYITRTIKREISERMHIMSMKSVQIAKQGRGKLALVPVIFVVLRIWGTIRFLFYACHYKVDHATIRHILLTLQLIGDNAQGISNFILFCVLTEKFKQQIIRVFQICCGAPNLNQRSSNVRKTFSDTKGLSTSCSNS